MAKTTVIVDDLDGTPDAQEVQFSYAGTSYTVDRSAENRRALEEALKPFIDAAARAAGGTAAGRGRADSKKSNKAGSSRSTKSRGSESKRSGRSDGAKSDVSLAAVRAWAAANGQDVSPRGRVPKAVLEAYDAAQTDNAHAEV